MEAGNCAAGDRNEHERPGADPVGVFVREMVPELRHLKTPGKEHGTGNAERHCDEQNAEYGVETSDHLVDGNERRYEIIEKNDPEPEHGSRPVIRKNGEKIRRSYREHHAAEDEQQHGKNAHYLPDPVTEAVAYDIGYGTAVIPHGDHPDTVIVDGAPEYAAEYDPQVYHRSEQRPRKRAEDRPRAGNIE